MTYIEKVRYLAKLKQNNDYDEDKYYIDISPEEIHWQEGELEKIIKPYGFVPEEYIDFVKEFDNLGLSFATFYGSKHIISRGFQPTWNTGLQEYIDELLEYSDIFKKDYFAFGKDPAGSVFAFNNNQEVIYFDIEDYDFENPEKIADNFIEFVDDCLMGKRLGEFLDEESEYYQYIKHLGWA